VFFVRLGIGAILGRVVSLFAGLVVFGIVVRLVMLILSPILPPPVMQVLTEGWNTLFKILAPGLGPIAALVILGMVISIFVGRRK
jgi:hypothetical protein